MVQLKIGNPFEVYRTKARAEATAFFNEMAKQNLHAELSMLLAIAKGADIRHPMELREERARETFVKIETAKTRADLEQALMTMRAPFGAEARWAGEAVLGWNLRKR